MFDLFNRHFVNHAATARLLHDLIRQSEFGFMDFCPAEFDRELPSAAPPQLLTPRLAAKVLAVSERTLWSMTKCGEIAAVRIGRSIRYDPRDLNRCIENSKSAGGKRPAAV